MGVLAEWRAARERRNRASQFIEAVRHAAEAQGLPWIMTRAQNPGEARFELTDAVRAIALIVAERDSLDDRTAADVAHLVSEQATRDAGSTGASRWSNRWRAYSQSLAARGDGEAPASRFARNMLDGATVASPTADELRDATVWVQTVRERANEALRTAFGAASLPEDRPPSSLRI